MTTKLNNHQIQYRSIEPIATLLIILDTIYVGICLVIKDNVKLNLGKALQLIMHGRTPFHVSSAYL